MGKDHAVNEEMSSPDASTKTGNAKTWRINSLAVSGAKMIASHCLMAGVLPKAQQPCPISESIEEKVNSEIEFGVELWTCDTVHLVYFVSYHAMIHDMSAKNEIAHRLATELFSVTAQFGSNVGIETLCHTILGFGQMRPKAKF